jgi:uncharacterized YccA/Bax inhibitor family protein
MTVQGTILKTGLAVAVLGAAAGFVWFQIKAGDPSVIGFLLPAALLGLLLGFVTSFWPTAAPWTTLPYAACEGVVLGTTSLLFEQRYPGIVIQGVALTFGTLFAFLVAYQIGLIRASAALRAGLVAGMTGVFLLYLVEFVLYLCGIRVPYLHESGFVGIAFSLFLVGLAAFNLVLDFDFVETGAKSGAPKYMEWYGAFGLLVTLVWLYLEVLRLLAKVQGRGSSSRSSGVSS